MAIKPKKVTMPTSKIVLFFIPFKTPLFLATTYVNALDKPKSNNDAEPIRAQYIEMNPETLHSKLFN